MPPPNDAIAKKAWRILQKKKDYREAYLEYIAAQERHVELTDSPFLGPQLHYSLNPNGKHFVHETVELLCAWRELGEKAEIQRILLRLAAFVGVDAMKSLRDNLDTLELDSATIEAIILAGLGATVTVTHEAALNAARPYRPGYYVGHFFHLLNPDKSFNALIQFLDQRDPTQSLKESFIQHIECGASIATTIYNDMTINPYRHLDKQGKILVEIDLRSTKAHREHDLDMIIKSAQSITGYHTKIKRGPSEPRKLTDDQKRRIDVLWDAGQRIPAITAELWEELKSENDGNLIEWVDSGHLHSTSVYKLIQRYLKNKSA
jgi:hypothetical protein